MSKTYRHSAESEDFGRQDHRIKQADIAEGHLFMERLLLKNVPRVKPRPKRVRLPRPVLSLSEWVPSKETAETPEGWHLRDSRLDLLQTLGEQMLYGFAEA